METISKARKTEGECCEVEVASSHSMGAEIVDPLSFYGAYLIQGDIEPRCVD